MAELEPNLHRRSSEATTRSWLLTNLPPISRLMLRPEAVPPRAADTPAQCLDLTPFYNSAITENWAALKADGNTWSRCPRLATSRRQYRGHFRGVILLDSIRQRREVPLYPVRVSGIPVHRRIHRTHFLCGASWGSNIGEERSARWVFHTAEGATFDRPLRLGTDVLDWWAPPDPAPLPQGMTVAWTGTNPASVKVNRRIWLFRVDLGQS